MPNGRLLPARLSVVKIFRRRCEQFNAPCPAKRLAGPPSVPRLGNSRFTFALTASDLHIGANYRTYRHFLTGA